MLRRWWWSCWCWCWCCWKNGGESLHTMTRGQVSRASTYIYIYIFVLLALLTCIYAVGRRCRVPARGSTFMAGITRLISPKIILLFIGKLDTRCLEPKKGLGLSFIYIITNSSRTIISTTTSTSISSIRTRTRTATTQTTNLSPLFFTRPPRDMIYRDSLFNLTLMDVIVETIRAFWKLTTTTTTT